MRCFSSPGSPSAPMDLARNDPMGRVSPFGNPRIKICSRFPEAYRRVQRPSSPFGAKASTKCPFALDRSAVAYRDKPRLRDNPVKTRLTSARAAAGPGQAWPFGPADRDDTIFTMSKSPRRGSPLPNPWKCGPLPRHGPRMGRRQFAIPCSRSTVGPPPGPIPVRPWAASRAAALWWR